MDGMHDLGGRAGFGVVEQARDETTFRARWEAAVFAMTLPGRTGHAISNIDQFRHAIERIDPVAYLTHGYYGRWLGGIENLMVEAGLLDPAELDRRVAARGGNPAARAARAVTTGKRDDRLADTAGTQSVAADAATGHDRALAAPPRFALGEWVRASAHGATGHTRLPAYARGRAGIVTARHGGWVFPDTHAHGRGECPTHLYTVTFTGAELWGPGGEPGVQISLDLFEPYLESCDLQV
ncbi:MAG: nitrile hydratase subunit beta [Gammaproteobacteria bacterium]